MTEASGHFAGMSVLWETEKEAKEASEGRKCRTQVLPVEVPLPHEPN